MLGKTQSRQLCMSKQWKELNVMTENSDDRESVCICRCVCVCEFVRACVRVYVFVCVFAQLLN